MELNDLKKGDKVIMRSFTKSDLGVFEVIEAKEKHVSVLKKNGEKAVFSRKTGKQINMAEGKERYANTIVPDDGSYTPMRPSERDAVKSTKKGTSKKKPTKKVEVEEAEEVGDGEVEETPKKKPTKKKSTKKVEEFEDEEFEDNAILEEDEEPKPKKKPTKKKKVVSDDEE